MALGQVREPPWLMDAPGICPEQISIVADRGSYVYDGGHNLFVMKKVKGPTQAEPSCHHEIRARWGPDWAYRCRRMRQATSRKAREVAHP